MIPNTLQAYDDKMEKILCKYMEHVPEGSRLSGEEMSELILEVSGNALDAEFVFRYLDYVEVGKNGKILKWDMNHAYLEGTEMKQKNTMLESITIGEIEKWYGKPTADALKQYCDAKEMDVDRVASNDAEWDKFEMWAKARKRKLGTLSSKFDNWRDAAEMDDKATTKKRKAGGVRRYDLPTDADIYGEGSGSRMDEQDVLDFIGGELVSCDWVSNLDYDDVDAKCYIDLNEGTSFEISIKRI